MGVEFPDLETLESTASAIGSNMFEGFEPTPRGIRLIRDYIQGKIILEEFIELAKPKSICLIITIIKGNILNISALLFANSSKLPIFHPIIDQH